MTADQPPLADCRARLAFDLLANTWNSVVIWALRDGPERPGRLRERIGGISPKVLNETLRRLCFNGLVERRAFPGAPPRVEYGLTGLGRSLLPSIGAFGAWAFEHGDAVMAAQERAEEAEAEAEAAEAGAAGTEGAARTVTAAVGAVPARGRQPVPPSGSSSSATRSGVQSSAPGAAAR